MRNSAIVAAYLSGTAATELMVANGCSLARIYSVLRAYDVKLRTRSQATVMWQQQRADQRDSRILTARAALNSTGRN